MILGWSYPLASGKQKPKPFLEDFSEGTHLQTKPQKFPLEKLPENTNLCKKYQNNYEASDHDWEAADKDISMKHEKVSDTGIVKDRL